MRNRRDNEFVRRCCRMAAGVILAIALSGCGQAGVHSDARARQNGEIGKRKKGRTVKEHRSGEWTPALTEDEKTTLFAIVTDTLRWCVDGSGKEWSFQSYEITDRMKVPTATFVTLKIGLGLRGCIGSLAPVEPMYESVHRNAINASMRDTRFRPVRPEELPNIDVHISMLSPMRDISSYEEFEVGKHGIVIQKSNRRAVFLPEVAAELKWTREETLTHLSEKAGLRSDAWREGASFRVFESVVLSR